MGLMDFAQFVTFANNAEWLGLAGGGFLLLALIAQAMDKRRLKRRSIDRVGFVPWTGVFVACAIIGGGMLALAVPALIAP
jgi:uncharacterized membrane protein SirB2